MKAPEYTVIKAMPGLKVGDVMESMDNSDFYWRKSNKEHTTITLLHSVIEDSPEYFKKVEEKEFTASDMVAYFEWRSSNSKFNADITVEDWLDHLAISEYEKP